MGCADLIARTQKLRDSRVWSTHDTTHGAKIVEFGWSQFDSCVLCASMEWCTVGPSAVVRGTAYLSVPGPEYNALDNVSKNGYWHQKHPEMDASLIQ